MVHLLTTLHSFAPRLAAVALVTAVMTGAARADETVDACSLLTQKQVSAILGFKVDPGVHPIPSFSYMCNWREINRPTGIARHALLTVITAREFDRIKTLPLTSASGGVGDDAVVTHSLRMPAILTVKSGAHYFRLEVRSNVEHSGEADERNQFLEQSLAVQVVKKL